MEIPRLSAKEAEILRLLIANREMYGLELVNASESLKRGTVYVTLGRMAEKGFVQSRQAAPSDGSGPPKRVYKATGHGARVFHAYETAAAVFGGGMAWAT
jgi:DNA-binding PadR family transcriptional regulator